MTSKTVCVPRELLERWRDSFMAWDSSPSNRMASEIAALLAQPMTSEPVAWVPISERLPDECKAQVLLCFAESGEVTLGYWSNIFSQWEFHYHIDFDEKTLTHWMPIPAKPQPTDGSTDD